MPAEIPDDHDVTPPEDATEAAVLRCGVCDEKFPTSAQPNGVIWFDGVREHGEENHEDERWGYEVLGRPGGDD